MRTSPHLPVISMARIKILVIRFNFLSCPKVGSPFPEVQK